MTAPVLDQTDTREQRDVVGRAPLGFDRSNRTFTVLFATENPVTRRSWDGDYDEILLCGPENVDQKRVDDKIAPVLRHYHGGDQCGIIDSIKYTMRDGTRCIEAVARLSRNQAGEEELVDIEDDIRRGISVGYRIIDADYRYAPGEGARDQLIITRWEILEITLCGVGLDRESGVGRTGDDSMRITQDQLEAYRAKAQLNTPTSTEPVVDTPRSEEPTAPTASTETVAEVVSPASPESDEAGRVSEGVEQTIVEVEEVATSTADASEARTPETNEATQPDPEVVEAVASAPDESGERTSTDAEDTVSDAQLDDDAPAVRASTETIMEGNEPTNDSTPSVEVRENQARTNERTRVTTINQIAAKHNLAEAGQRAIDEGTSVEQFAQAALREIEARQVALASQPSVDLSPKERQAYSLGAAVRAHLNGSWAGRGSSLEREVHDEMEKKGQNPKGERSILVPHDMFGARAVSVTTGSAQHIVPQTQQEYMPHLTSTLALVKAGMTVLPGLLGQFDFPAGDVLGSAGTPGENATQADSEATFKNARAIPKPIRTRGTFSRTLLNNSVPATDALLERILQARLREKIENQCFVGAGGANEFAGIDGLAGVGDGSFTNGVVTYGAFRNMATVVDDQKGLIGPAAYVTTMGVINKGLTTSRFGGDGFLGVLSMIPGAEADAFLDGYSVFRSHEVAKNYPSPTSPSDLIAHGLYFGVWEELFLCLFGPAVDILVDPYGDASNGNIIIWANQDADLVVPQTKVLAKAINVLV